MQNRSRDYYRKMRAKHIRRKKNIVRHWKWWSDNNYNYYPHDGMYSKNKIHCSCPLCKEKARHNGKHILTEREIISIMKMYEQLKSYNETTYSVASGDWSYKDHDMIA